MMCLSIHTFPENPKRHSVACPQLSNASVCKQKQNARMQYELVSFMHPFHTLEGGSVPGCD